MLLRTKTMGRHQFNISNGNKIVKVIIMAMIMSGNNIGDKGNKVMTKIKIIMLAIIIKHT